MRGFDIFMLVLAAGGLHAQDRLGDPSRGERASAVQLPDGGRELSAVRALDPRTGERKWQLEPSSATDSGILTTATDLLFTGNREGYFLALDARNGSLPWRTSLGGIVIMGPISYSADGRQYLAVAAGNSLFVFGLREWSL